jgi:hypothetical protein
METEAGAPVPALFPSTAGAVFPLYHVLAEVGAFAGGDIERIQSGDPLGVAVLALRRGPHQSLLVANLRTHPCRIDLTALSPARPNPGLDLPPYGFTCVPPPLHLPPSHP